MTDTDRLREMFAKLVDEWDSAVPAEEVLAMLQARIEQLSAEKHNEFCSAAGSPCPIHCETWPECAADMFPSLTGACPAMCPVHRGQRPSADPMTTADRGDTT